MFFVIERLDLQKNVSNELQLQKDLEMFPRFFFAFFIQTYRRKAFNSSSKRLANLETCVELISTPHSSSVICFKGLVETPCTYISAIESFKPLYIFPAQFSSVHPVACQGPEQNFQPRR
jgi:hypothetical protein